MSSDCVDVCFGGLRLEGTAEADWLAGHGPCKSPERMTVAYDGTASALLRMFLGLLPPLAISRSFRLIGQRSSFSLFAWKHLLCTIFWEAAAV